MSIKIYSKEEVVDGGAYPSPSPTYYVRLWNQAGGVPQQVEVPKETWDNVQVGQHYLVGFKLVSKRLQATKEKND